MPYFQDEWKVTPTLTLTAGVRWDYYEVAYEATNRTTVFDLYQFHGVCLGSGSFNTLPVPASSGPINTPPCPRNPSLYNPSYRNFDPGIALAWAPGTFHGKTVFRTGFGIYHGAAQNDDLNARLESDTFRVQYNQTNAMLQGTTGVNGNKPVLNANAFGIPTPFAPGANGVPPCDPVSGACDPYENGYTAGGRNIFRAPFQSRFDFGVSKDINITERYHLK